MENFSWTTIGNRWSSSVLQLISIQAKYDISRPYATPKHKEFRATGFIIDIEKGIVVTNAHVLSKALTITGRSTKLGQYSLILKPINITPSKDIGLCQLDLESIQMLTDGVKNPTDLNLLFDDHITLNQTEEVMAIGYPLGRSDIEMTIGNISGVRSYANKDDEKDLEIINSEDSLDRNPSVIQITTPINPGNSGGPLLNKKGYVVGITSGGIPDAQNIGYAIGSRIFLTHYALMLQHCVLYGPNLSLGWCNTTFELLNYKCPNYSITGIYVRKVERDSCLPELLPGDILTHLSFQDINSSKSWITCYFDNFGDSEMYYQGPSTISQKKPNIKPLISRKLSMAEVCDMIPLGSNLQLRICRNKQLISLSSKYSYVPSNRILKVYPIYTKLDYEIFAGLCIMPLTLNHCKRYPALALALNDLYQPQLIITQVFSQTVVDRAHVFSEGDILKTVNGLAVSNLSQLRSIIRDKPALFEIITENDSILCISALQILSDLAFVQPFL